MGLINTMQTGASGLSAIGAGLGIVGDNIANINTTGFKGSRANFADVMPQFLGTSNGGGRVGMGTAIGSVATNFSQGSLMSTGSALDIGIQGGGWFQVNNGAEGFFTRDGHFGLDKDNFVVNASGMRLQGYQAQNGAVTSAVGDMQLDLGGMAPSATTQLTLDANLNPDGDFAAGGTPLAAIVGAGAPQLSDMSTAADYSTSTTMYDSLGQAHTVSVFFEQTGAGAWHWYAAVDAQEAGTGGPGEGLVIAEGDVAFDTSGELDATNPPTSTLSPTAWNWPGADPLTSFDLDLGMDSAGAATLGSLTQQAGASTTHAISQDGMSPGSVTGVRVGADGRVLADYDNGQDMVVGQLALATFAADGGLDPVGGNLYKASLESGDPAMGVVGAGGRGSTISYALEGSNVALEDEFVLMIQGQRAYQANAGTIRTADETLQALVNLV